MPKLRVIIKPPPEPQGEPEQQVEALRDYLLQMSEELAYVLTHLEADNINDSTFERIQNMIPRPYTGLPVMDGEASAGQSEQWARGDHRHGHDSTKADVTALEETAGDLADHVADIGNPHEVTAAQVGLGNVDNVRQYSASNPPPIPTPGEVGAIPTTEKGSAGGVAELDSSGHVPSSQLPSYVDDVKEYPSVTDFPIPGESDKIYIALDTDLFYRWGGTVYAPTNPSLALGETSSTAYRGDRGKTAYDHSQVTSGNPHNVTAAEVGARADTWMPTASDVGARPDTWTPTAADVGARPDTWTPTAADVGARPDDWVPDAEDVPYDNTGSGLMATDVQAAIDELAQGGGGGGTAAAAVSYDNTDSGIAATNVQDAIDEVVTDLDGKQDALTIDATPTANSTNPVQSGGVYTDVRTRVPNYGKGKNLLRNWYFVGGGTGRGVFPVNQRGLNSYSGNVYVIDAYHGDSGASLALTQNGTQLSYSSGSLTSMYQYIENPTFLMGKKITLSILDSNGFHTASGTVPSSSPGSLTNIININDTDIFRVRISSNGIISFVWISNTPSSSATKRTVYAAKLELGTEQTLAHQENGTWVLNEIPDYEYELYRCMTSTADPSDTYANKSLATEQQLAYVETGTTASRNYTAGEYICWNGLTYTADTAIASGATFYTSGGNKNLTVCGGGGFNGLFVTKTFTHTIASISRYTFIDGTSDVTVAGYVPIAVNTFDINEDHCIIQKLGFISSNINKLYYRIKNYDSAAAANVTIVVRVLYARASLTQL